MEGSEFGMWHLRFKGYGAEFRVMGGGGWIEDLSLKVVICINCSQQTEGGRKGRDGGVGMGDLGY